MRPPRRPPNVTRSPEAQRPLLSQAPWRLTALAGLASLALGGCTTVSDSFMGAKVDYRAGAVKTAPLDIPPDLTQLSSDPRYQAPTGAPVSAAALQGRGAAAASPTAPAATAATGPVASTRVPGLRVERVGQQRWLVSSQSPEVLWPLVKSFWTDNGFTLIEEQAAVGMMETDWRENRARLPQDFVRRTIGRVFDSLYDTSERDRYRTRLERTAQGTEIYISHRGAAEVSVGDKGESTRWVTRPSDAQLEAEMLARLMLRLGGPVESVAAPAAPQVATATQAVVATPEPAARARLQRDGGVLQLQVDDGFDRAWRRAGLALDRNSFTVEDRDRSQGAYLVRYVDPKLAGQADPGFLARLFGAKRQDLAGQRYRLKVTGTGTTSVIRVLDATQGTPLDGEAAKAILDLLLIELR